MAEKDDRVLVGAITGAHGIRGEVKLRSFTQELTAIARYGVLATASGKTIRVIAVKPDKGGLVARLSGVADRSQAEALKGEQLFVPRNRLPEVRPGEAYVHDLIGSAVRLKDGTLVGEVAGVSNYGAGDLIEIRFAGRKETVLVPFADPFVPEIDPEQRTVTVDLPEEYLDAS
ncbi:MAG: ribosome maturation factor RimM [Hyphomicrobiales bacterium]